MMMMIMVEDLGHMEDFPSVDMVFPPQPMEPMKVIILGHFLVTENVLCVLGILNTHLSRGAQKSN